jgi:hypothetical protein
MPPPTRSSCCRGRLPTRSGTSPSGSTVTPVPGDARASELTRSARSRLPDPGGGFLVFVRQAVPVPALGPPAVTAVGMDPSRPSAGELRTPQRTWHENPCGPHGTAGEESWTGRRARRLPVTGADRRRVLSAEGFSAQWESTASAGRRPRVRIPHDPRHGSLPSWRNRQRTRLKSVRSPFDPEGGHAVKQGPAEQRSARQALNLEIAGSNPAWFTQVCRRSSMGERWAVDPEVAGSIPAGGAYEREAWPSGLWHRPAKADRVTDGGSNPLASATSS